MSARQFNIGLEVINGLITANPTYDTIAAGDLPATYATYTIGTWTPTFTGLVTVGSPTITGRYTQIGRMVFFTVKVVAATTTAATGGTTHCDLPVAAAQDGTCVTADKTTNVGLGTGTVDAIAGYCYPAAWAATADAIIISGSYES